MFNINKMKSFDQAAKFSELSKVKSKVENKPKLNVYWARRKDTPK